MKDEIEEFIEKYNIQVGDYVTLLNGVVLHVTNNFNFKYCFEVDRDKSKCQVDYMMIPIRTLMREEIVSVMKEWEEE